MKIWSESLSVSALESSAKTPKESYTLGAGLCRNALSKSIGNGKMIVEFFSALKQ